MAHALNLTMKIRQDSETQARLAQIKAAFPSQIQPKIDQALRDSQIVHFARVLVIDNLYLQVITEYDGEHRAYTDFFLQHLPDVFGTLFSLADPPPPASAIEDPEEFWKFSKGLQIPSLGTSVDDDTDGEGHVAGYLFSAYGTREVKDILPLLTG